MCAEIDIIEHCLVVINTLELCSIVMNTLKGKFMGNSEGIERGMSFFRCLYGFLSSLI